MARDYAAQLFTLLTQARLVRVNMATHEVEPWLAESWTSSPDGLVHTPTLRDGLKWSDGLAFSSADVAFTFAAVFDPRVKSVLASSLEVDGDPLTVATPDARTVVVTFPHPFGPGIRLLDNVTILPKHKLEAALTGGTMATAWGTTTPPAEIVGMGPFVLSQYEPGQRLTFARNPHYWRKDDRGIGLPYLDGLVLRIVPDQNAEFLQVSNGGLDVMTGDLRPDDLAAARAAEQAGSVRLYDVGVGLDPDMLWLNLRGSERMAATSSCGTSGRCGPAGRNASQPPTTRTRTIRAATATRRMVGGSVDLDEAACPDPLRGIGIAARRP